MFVALSNISDLRVRYCQEIFGSDAVQHVVLYARMLCCGAAGYTTFIHSILLQYLPEAKKLNWLSRSSLEHGHTCGTCVIQFESPQHPRMSNHKR